AAGPALRPLGDLAEVRRGLTTGANDVFYLPRARAAALGLEGDALVPLLRSPRAAGERIAVDPDGTPHLALLVPAGAGRGSHPAALRYLDEAAPRARGATLAARDPWWALP